MRLIILAAGEGSRLTGTSMPKTLLHLGNGETVAERLIRQADLPTTVVIGYKADTVTRWLKGKADFVYNQAWHKTSPVYSLELATVRKPGPYLVVYGDTVFKDESIKEMIELPGTVGVYINRWGGPYFELDGVVTRVSSEPISDFGSSGIINMDSFNFNRQERSIGYCVAGYKYHVAQSININTDENLVEAREWIKSL